MPEENELTNLPDAEVKASPAETPPEVTATTPTGDEGKPKDIDATPDASSLQAEIEDLKRQRDKAKEDAIKWRKEKASARAEFFRDRERSPETQDPAAKPGKEPQASDFENYDDYVRAVSDARVKAAKEEWERESRQRQLEESNKQKMQDLHAKLQEGFTKYDDFEEIVFDRSAGHITPMIVDILADCDNPADVAYHLAKNRIEGVAISRMTPTQAARAIARLESQLASTPASPKPLSPKTTNAPPPIKPLGGAGGSSLTTKDPDKMTLKEFNEWRRQQGAKPY